MPPPLPPVVALYKHHHPQAGAIVRRGTEKGYRHSRNQMPVSETNVGTTLKPTIKLVVEETKLRFSRNAAALDASVCGEIVVRGNDGPMMGNLHVDRSIHGLDLEGGHRGKGSA